jgi:hypothetical protein
LPASGSGRRSLKKYELSNLLFFLVIIAALVVLVSFVFRYYGTRNEEVAENSERGVIDYSLPPGENFGIFYLGTKLVETNHEYRNRLDIPVTDDGFLKELFAVPGIDGVTLNQKVIIIRKNTSARWESILPEVRRIVKNHLHIHF